MSSTAPTILITGSTDGLGKALALKLAGEGASVILHGRNPERCARVSDEIERSTGRKPAGLHVADFASLASIRSLAQAVTSDSPRLDVLVNNAGIGVESQRSVSRDGYELTFQVDYLSTYMLSLLLLPVLQRSGSGRIVNVASAGQAPIDFNDVMLERSWDGVQAYCQAKLAQVMFTLDLADSIQPGLTVNTLHPASYMPTKIVSGRFSVQSTIDEGVEAVRRLAVDAAIHNLTGRYYDRTREARAHCAAYDAGARSRLRTVSEQLTGVAMVQPSADPEGPTSLALGRLAREGV